MEQNMRNLNYKRMELEHIMKSTQTEINQDNTNVDSELNQLDDSYLNDDFFKELDEVICNHQIENFS